MRLIDEQGRPLRLGAKVGEGGEGSVYRLAGLASEAVKVYSSPLTEERARKIRVLARCDQQFVSRFAAWPSGLVFDERKQPRGLLLPYVQGGKDVHHLYTPSSRRQHFPAAGWRFLVHVSTNVARAFAAIHRRGFVIGDVNPGSILVLADGTVRLIDVDSFQVPVPGSQPLLCTVAVPLFLPPELHQANLASVVRTPNHDAFGLAITIFQLLLLGRHPYAGRYLGAGEMPIERAIKEQRFAYSRFASRSDMQPPPNTVGLEILPSSLANLFESAFRGQGLRPSAKDWVDALSRLSANLTKCGRDSTHEYARESRLCPWCAFEQKTSVLLFGLPQVGTDKGHDEEYQKLVASIAAIQRPLPATPSIVAAATAVPEARSAMPTRWSWMWYFLAFLLAFGGLFLLPIGMFLVACGAGIAIVRTCVTSLQRKPWIDAYRAARADHAIAANELAAANRFPRHAAAQSTVAHAQRVWQDLPRRKAEKYRELTNNKRQMQLRQFLQRKNIRSAKISGVGPARVAMLSAYGIDTAWDVSGARVGQVPQFGPVLTDRLVAWRRTIEQSFHYDPSTPLPKEAVANVEKEIEETRRRVVADLRRALRELQLASTTETANAAAVAQKLTIATSRLSQAEADVVAATGRIPE